MELSEDLQKGVAVAELRKKYSPQFVRENYNPKWTRGPVYWRVEYLHWICKECFFDINLLQYDVMTGDKGEYRMITISFLDDICTSVRPCTEKLESICFLLSIGAKSRIGLDRLLSIEMGNWRDRCLPSICFRLMDAGAAPPYSFGNMAIAYHSRLATRAACIAVLSLHGKLPAGQVAQQCLSRDMLGAVAQAMWARRIQVMEESVAAEGLL